MEITISCDDEGLKFLADLFTQALEDKWDAERCPPEPLYHGTKVFVPKNRVSEIIIW